MVENKKAEINEDKYVIQVGILFLFNLVNIGYMVMHLNKKN